MSKSFYLVLTRGPGPGQVFSIEKDEITIGRDIQCDISIIESSVSRRHARVLIKDEGVFVEDLGSTNGTTIDGEAVEGQHQINVGDVVGLGQNIEFMLNESLPTDQATEVFSRDMLQSVVPEKRQSKVFISYSRRNQPFVEKLHASLTKKGVDTWVDWEGIPLTADWWAEIVDAIEGADGFVFVISPDSLASEICERELNTAIELNKRLIPILHIEPEKGSEIPDQISSHNWVFMKDEKELEEMLPNLIDSIHTDLGWVQTHTRLLRRASEWERQEKNTSFLLQGDDLQNAENWLKEAGENKTQPTPLHFEYIQVSRSNANRRQRTITIASLAALAVTLVLFIVSVFLGIDANNSAIAAENSRQTAVAEGERALAAEAVAKKNEEIAREAEKDAKEAEAVAKENEEIAKAAKEEADMQRDAANEAREEAERQAAIASAGEISANALTIVESNPILAALLALEAQRISQDNPTSIEVLSLVPAYYPPIAGVIPNPGWEYTEVAWSPDGRLALAMSGFETNIIGIWDPESEEIIMELEGHEWFIYSLAWSEDGRMASGDESGNVIVWDMERGEPEYMLPNYQEDISDLAWSPRGTLASTSYDYSLIVWDLDEPEDSIYVQYPYAGLSSVAWNPFGGLVTGADNGAIISWDTASWDILFEYYFHDAGVLSLDFNSEGQLASGSKDGTVGISSIFTGQGQKLNGHTDWVNVVDWSDDDQLASASWDDRVILWDLEKRAPDQILLGHIGAVGAMDWGPDGQLASAVNFVYIWDPQSSPAMTTLQGHLDWVHDIGWMDDGTLISHSFDGNNFLWDLESRTPSASFASRGFGLDISSEGLLVSGGGVVDPATGNEYFLTAYSMEFSPDSSLIAGINDDIANLVQVWDLAAVMELGAGASYFFELDDTEEAAALAWHPEGTRLAIGADDGSIYLWDVFSEDVLVLDEHSGAIEDLVWGPDGQLVSSSTDFRHLIWDVDAGAVVKELTGIHNASPAGMDWSPNGWLATADDKGRIVIWDVETWELITVIQSPYRRRVNAVAWSPDGSKLAFSGNSYNVYVYNTLYMQEPCSWLARNILAFEWESYFPDRDYESTCPNLP